MTVHYRIKEDSFRAVKYCLPVSHLKCRAMSHLAWFVVETPSSRRPFVGTDAVVLCSKQDSRDARPCNCPWAGWFTTGELVGYVIHSLRRRQVILHIISQLSQLSQLLNDPHFSLIKLFSQAQRIRKTESTRLLFTFPCPRPDITMFDTPFSRPRRPYFSSWQYCGKPALRGDDSALINFKRLGRFRCCGSVLLRTKLSGSRYATNWVKTNSLATQPCSTLHN